MNSTIEQSLISIYVARETFNDRQLISILVLCIKEDICDRVLHYVRNFPRISIFYFKSTCVCVCVIEDKRNCQHLRRKATSHIHHHLGI